MREGIVSERERFVKVGREEGEGDRYGNGETA